MHKISKNLQCPDEMLSFAIRVTLNYVLRKTNVICIVTRSLTFIPSRSFHDFLWYFLQNCFLFRETGGEDSDTYSKIQVSENFQIISLNWGGIFKSLRKNWIHKSANKTKNQDKWELMTWDWENKKVCGLQAQLYSAVLMRHKWEGPSGGWEEKHQTKEWRRVPGRSHCLSAGQRGIGPS